MRNIYGHGTVVWLKRRGKERKKEQSLELCFVGEKGRKEKEGVTEYPRTTRAKSLCSTTELAGNFTFRRSDDNVGRFRDSWDLPFIIYCTVLPANNRPSFSFHFPDVYLFYLPLKPSFYP